MNRGRRTSCELGRSSPDGCGSFQSEKFTVRSSLFAVNTRRREPQIHCELRTANWKLQAGYWGLAGAVYPLLLLSWALMSTGAATNRALEIMREVERRQLTDSQSNIGAIEVVDGKGKVLNKSWQFWREGNRGQSKVLIRFVTPPEVRGVGFLTLNHPGAPAEQWLYTPAIQRDRRVAPQEKSQRFMGTDLTHEDIEERSIEDYDYDLVGEEAFAGQPAYKIKAVYKHPGNTQYSQLYLWIRKDIVATAYIEFYIAAKLRKAMRWDDWKQIQGIWTPHLMEVKDLARGSLTRIRSSDVKYSVRFEPDWFSLRNLRRVP